MNPLIAVLLHTFFTQTYPVCVGFFSHTQDKSRNVATGILSIVYSGFYIPYLHEKHMATASGSMTYRRTRTDGWIL